jgi:hypothetical protein
MNDFQPSAQSCKEAEVVSDQAPSDEAVSERDEPSNARARLVSKGDALLFRTGLFLNLAKSVAAVWGFQTEEEEGKSDRNAGWVYL